MAKSYVLVVEDDKLMRRLLVYRLGQLYDVQAVCNGEEALALIASRSSLPDLIISDVMMPAMDGFALQAALRANPETRPVKFIFLSARADAQTRERGIAAGADDFITKPFDLNDLLHRVARQL